MVRTLLDKAIHRGKAFMLHLNHLSTHKNKIRNSVTSRTLDADSLWPYRSELSCLMFEYALQQGHIFGCLVRPLVTKSFDISAFCQIYLKLLQKYWMTQKHWNGGKGSMGIVTKMIWSYEPGFLGKRRLKILVTLNPNC